MKTLHVTAAIIIEEGKVFATQRGYGEFKDGWEFPGGKIEDGETPEEALRREIMEELDTKVMVGELFDTVEYDYPKFHLSMQCYLCQVKEGDLRLKEHENAKWLDREHLFDVDWLPADIGIISHLEKKLS
ncbi:8-oxo-dGTP diphosphatase MutT [Blautia liquoris]|uniref:8-oxo-dGTP diphosphatase n=1 Tax=Blautia liquoris TaxID=2779518 RepID=A0A7M2RIH0_9FIRM|nr:8-oxo-dGTP diphosphatase MutT [Blautia liquoris]QOV19152.1 8-oxo-dGTP diphosphatase MutT [Blautia liquoris]